MAKLIWVAGGKKLATGQVALCEEHPDHPADNTGTHLGFVAKDDPVFGRALVAATPEVGRKLALNELVQIAAPEPEPEPAKSGRTGRRAASGSKSTKATKPEETQTAEEIAAAEAAAAALAAAESGLGLDDDPGDDPDDNEDE